GECFQSGRPKRRRPPGPQRLSPPRLRRPLPAPRQAPPLLLQGLCAEFHARAARRRCQAGCGSRHARTRDRPGRTHAQVRTLIQNPRGLQNAAGESDARRRSLDRASALGLPTCTQLLDLHHVSRCAPSPNPRLRQPTIYRRGLTPNVAVIANRLRRRNLCPYRNKRRWTTTVGRGPGKSRSLPVSLVARNAISLAYTPGVAEPCL